MTLDQLKQELVDMEAVMASIPSSISIDCTGHHADRIADAIKLLTHVSDTGRAFNISTWYGYVNAGMFDGPVTEEMLHACGTTACAIGWIATSQMWRDAGGRIDLRVGRPIMLDKGGEELDGIDAAEYWFNIPRRAATAMFIGGGTSVGRDYKYSSILGRQYTNQAYTKYSPYASEHHIDLNRPVVTAADVATALKQILNTNTLTCNKWKVFDLGQQIEEHKLRIAKQEQECD